MFLVDLIVGARPNFMKIAPIIRALKAKQTEGSTLQYRLVHTGQHYDQSMSEQFFLQLDIPKPDINLEVGSGTQAEQTAGIMVRYEKLLMEKSSQLCLVVGDVTSTMACSIVAQKLGIKVAHVEAGIRSHDWKMPEEINRLVTDVITNYFFTTSVSANENLQRAGVPEEKIFFVGNTMIDTLLYHWDQLVPPIFWDTLKLEPQQYFVVTLHRPSNVDHIDHLMALLSVMGDSARNLPMIFPVHPRTKKILHGMSLPKNIYLVEPQGYFQFNYLVKHAFAVITDSGGITEETTVMGVPCITLRDTTERPETVSIGTNELIGTNPQALKDYLDLLFQRKWKKGSIPEKWDGKTGVRIVEILESLAKNISDLGVTQACSRKASR
jgi:UDP-N-acetylglucosamine 2-epimerase (non-hydrolysing)